jgi:hypothetical protein
LALQLARRLCGLPELAMRRVVFTEELARLPPHEVVAMLRELLALASTNTQPPCSIAVATLAASLSDSPLLTYELRSRLYAAAREVDLDEVASLFFSAPKAAGDPVDPEQPVVPRGKALTLGERRALARSGRRGLLEHLLRDPDAAVIRVLLENPRLTEGDAVVVASRRNARGDVLCAVFESRWIARYHVKRALVMNPRSPIDLTVRLVATLAPADQRDVARDPTLATPLRSQAQRLLALGHRAS